MGTSTLAKAALCICPPALLATTAAVVPPVRHAVHHLTREHHGHAHAGRPAASHAAARAPCAPGLAALPSGILSGNDLAPPLPVDVLPPGAFTAIIPGSDTGGPAPVDVTPFPGGPFPVGPGLPATPVGPGPAPAVPEPSVWTTMILGFAAIGASLRRTRRPRASEGLGFGAAAGGMGLLARAAPAVASEASGAIVAKTAGSTLLAKAAMCVCSTAAVVATATMVPPVRHAIHDATAPSHAAVVQAATTAPCDDTQQTTVQPLGADPQILPLRH